MICSNDKLSIRRQTTLLGVSRSSYYYGPAKPESAENVAVMNYMDTEYHDRPATGGRKLRNLLIRDGIVECIGRDRIRRLRRKMGLQTVYRSPRTTIPGPSSMIRPYLLKDLEIARANQVWCTDITYIRMEKGYLYLTVIMDWYSRLGAVQYVGDGVLPEGAGNGHRGGGAGTRNFEYRSGDTVHVCPVARDSRRAGNQDEHEWSSALDRQRCCGALLSHHQVRRGVPVGLC